MPASTGVRVERLVVLAIGLAGASYGIHAVHHDERDPQICCPSGIPGHCDMRTDAMYQQCQEELEKRDRSNRAFDHGLVVVDVSVVALATYLSFRRRLLGQEQS